MSRRVAAVSTLALFTMVYAACQTAPAGLSDADKATLRQNDETFAKAANAKDFATCVSLYTDDGAMLPPNSATLQGRAEIQKWMAGFPPFSDFKLDIVDIDGRGDLAYVRGNYSMTISPAGAAPIHDHGKYVEILRKQSDGSWKMKWDIFNSDVPAPGQ